MESAQDKDSVNTLRVQVGGMHCSTCEVLIERKLQNVPGVRSVTADCVRGTATIRHEGEPDIAALNQAVGDDGYTVQLASHDTARNSRRDYVEIGAAFAVLLGAFLLARQFDLIPNSLGISENISYGPVFLIGLAASVSSCMAVTGGLLVAIAAKYNEATDAHPGVQRLKPLLYFNAGRVVSYTLLGGAVGAAGSTLMLSPSANGVLTIVASAVMILLGLQMLKLLPSFAKIMPGFRKRLAHRVHDLAAPEAKGGAFALGAATFFLPCGFTQALQLYVFSKGSFTVGALTMLAFALGTLPALLSLSALSSFASGAFQRHFLKFAGAAVIVLGMLNIQYGLVLSGSGFRTPVENSAAQSTSVAAVPAQTSASQVIVMRISDFDYIPNRFTVKQGVPVIWRIDGSEAAGCGRILLAPGLGIRRILSSDSTTMIAFTPQVPGDYEFNCGMGMMTPDSKITVIPQS